MWTLLHGFTGSPRSWNAVIRHATLDEEPSAPLLGGHGSDWKSRDTESFAGEVARLLAVASSQDRPRFVAGYSLGARVALGMLAADPKLFDGAVLVGVHPGLEDESARSERLELDRGRAHQLRTEGLEAFVSDWEANPLFETQRHLPEEVVRQQREVRLSHDPEGLARALEILGLAAMPSYAEVLSSIDLPIILMAGAHDAKFRNIALELSNRNAGLEPVIVEGAGHNLLLEASEAVAMAMSRVERNALGRARG